jgi:hypothetical protein
LYSVTAPVAPEKSYALDAQLLGDGKITLAIDGKLAAEGNAPGLIPKQPEESMDVGFDSGAPVAKYKNKATDPFQGSISGLTIVTADAGRP